MYFLLHRWTMNSGILYYQEKNTMKLSTTIGDFAPYVDSHIESLRYIRQAGFRNVDYDFGLDFNRRNGIYSREWKTYLEDVKRTADELGIKFVQSHAPMGRPLDREPAFMNDSRRCIEACAFLEIPSVVVHSGYAMGLTKEECLLQNKDFFMELLAFAESYGVEILVENFNKMCVEGLYWIDNAPDLRTMVDLVDHPLFHAVWDTGHANMQDMPQDEALRILGHHVHALHVQDNFGDQDAHMLPFLGTLNLDSLMHGLIDIGYKGYFSFEVGRVFLPGEKRNAYEADTRLRDAPLSVKIALEKLMYEVGKATLEAYGLYEE